MSSRGSVCRSRLMDKMGLSPLQEPQPKPRSSGGRGSQGLKTELSDTTSRIPALGGSSRQPPAPPRPAQHRRAACCPCALSLLSLAPLPHFWLRAAWIPLCCLGSIEKPAQIRFHRVPVSSLWHPWDKRKGHTAGMGLEGIFIPRSGHSRPANH